MRDLVFLFGAGASTGAGAILPERPPLGGQLYAELRRLFPRSWGSLPKDVHNALALSFEGGMGLVAEQYGMAVPPLMRDMAIYFIQFRPIGRASLFNRLAAQLLRLRLIERTIFSTLNYDCVLEFALLEEGIGIDYFGNGSATETPVWKLHGSCNMFSAGIQAGQGISYGQGVAFDAGIQAWLDPSRVIEHCLVETGLAPAMCQYMVGKPTTVAPSTIRDLQTRWAEAVRTARLVVCVGVRPYEPDTHIWTPLHDSPSDLAYAGDESAYGAWATGRQGAVFPLASRFAEGFDNLVTRLEGL